MVELLVIPFVVVVRDALADGATPRALSPIRTMRSRQESLMVRTKRSV